MVHICANCIMGKTNMIGSDFDANWTYFYQHRVRLERVCPIEKIIRQRLLERETKSDALGLQ